MLCSRVIDLELCQSGFRRDSRCPSSQGLGTPALQSVGNSLAERPGRQLRRLDRIVDGNPEGPPDLLAVPHAVAKAEVLQAAVDCALEAPLREGADDGRGAGARHHDPEGLLERLPEVLCAPGGGERVAAGVEEAQVVRVDEVPRAEGDGGVVRLGGVLQGRPCGEPAGGAVVWLEVVPCEEVSVLAAREEPAVGLDELFGLLGDEAPDGVSEEGFSLEGGWCLAGRFIG